MNKLRTESELLRALLDRPTESEIIKALDNKPVIDSEFMNAIKNSKPDMVDMLKHLQAIEWEKEGNSKDWNTRARELNAKNKDRKAVKAIHRSIFGY